MHRRHGVQILPPARTAWLLDDAWPEYASMLASSARAGDQIIAPGLFGTPLPARYRWPGAVEHRATLATARRHLAMRRVAKAPGGVRQSAYLRQDRAMARVLARSIDYRAGHLVIAQAWLPWLDEAGMLGGRTFDVVMSRYPMAEIHRLLDSAAAEIGESATIGDFRADPGLVDRESALLRRARRIVTPHCGIAALLPDRALKLAWHRPPAIARKQGNRIAFLGPTIDRQRPDLVRDLARSLDEPLILLGDLPTESDFWSGISIERRERGPGWLDGIGAILHPAVLTSQPRALLEAVANGVTVYATPECGLEPGEYRAMADFGARQSSLPA